MESQKMRKRSTRVFPESVKISAITRVRGGETIASVSRSMEIAESTIRGWCKREKESARGTSTLPSNVDTCSDENNGRMDTAVMSSENSSLSTPIDPHYFWLLQQQYLLSQHLMSSSTFSPPYVDLGTGYGALLASIYQSSATAGAVSSSGCVSPPPAHQQPATSARYTDNETHGALDLRIKREEK